MFRPRRHSCSRWPKRRLNDGIATCLLWVMSGKPPGEHMSSGRPNSGHGGRMLDLDVGISLRLHALAAQPVKDAA